MCCNSVLFSSIGFILRAEGVNNSVKIGQSYHGYHNVYVDWLSFSQNLAETG